MKEYNSFDVLKGGIHLTIERLKNAKDFLENQLGSFKPEVLVVLGSGLGFLSEKVSSPLVVDYKDIPDFPSTTVEGHEGKLVFGELFKRKVMIMKGRFHYYEGHQIDKVVFPIYLAWALGVKRILLTNAAGGINRMYKPGDIVAVKDIINFMFVNPLRGENDERIGPRFPDMSTPVDREWLDELLKVKSLKTGVYIAVMGPSYETPSEIKMFEKLGADLVGMSTVPEVIAAKHCGMKILILSCVSNMAAGILKEPLSHEDVIKVTKMVKDKFASIVQTALEVMK
ncbi:MAG TPA: purine-nucleoside phosphorylase [Thermotoga sp.]|nr:purine-nucleoside phosphorylase [Thermotoga sp.]